MAGAALLTEFRRHDVSGSGLVARSAMVSLLVQLCELRPQDVRRMLEAAGLPSTGDQVPYEPLLQWVFPDEPFPLPQKTSTLSRLPVDDAAQLGEISSSLAMLAEALRTVEPEVAAQLLGHARLLKNLEQKCVNPTAPSDFTETPRSPLASARTNTAQSERAPRKSMRVHTMQSEMASNQAVERPEQFRRFHHQGEHALTDEELSYRGQARMLVEHNGCTAGSAISDLKEVSVGEVRDRMALSYWRFCEGLKLYRSPTVSKALRLICSAHVPGLGGPTYLDVFSNLTKSAWENHIYLFGGLVRDILRRTVGNDIDIGFSAPATELEKICQKQGYSCELDDNYIVIGDADGEEYLEGMVISHNGIQPDFHADFSMNTLFYDFCNDIIIDKLGTAVPAVLENRLRIPCVRDKWDSWMDINGVRVAFRYFKFLLRGYEYVEDEMAYVTETLLQSWSDDVENTLEVGRIALGNLVGTDDTGKIEMLRKFVIAAFDMVITPPKGVRPVSKPHSLPGGHRSSLPGRSFTMALDAAPTHGSLFLSANQWWQRGWKVLLKLDQNAQ